MISKCSVNIENIPRLKAKIKKFKIKILKDTNFYNTVNNKITNIKINTFK